MMVTTMIGASIGLAIISAILSAAALVVSMVSVAKIKGFEESTHQIQYMPVELPKDETTPENKHLNMLEEDPEAYDERKYDDYVKEIREKKKKWKEKIESFYDLSEDDDNI